MLAAAVGWRNEDAVFEWDVDESLVMLSLLADLSTKPISVVLQFVNPKSVSSYLLSTGKCSRLNGSGFKTFVKSGSLGM